MVYFKRKHMQGFFDLTISCILGRKTNTKSQHHRHRRLLIGAQDKPQGRMPPREVVAHQEGSQVASPRGAPSIDRNRDPHALVGATEEVVAPHQGAIRRTSLLDRPGAPIPEPTTVEEYQTYVE